MKQALEGEIPEHRWFARNPVYVIAGGALATEVVERDKTRAVQIARENNARLTVRAG